MIMELATGEEGLGIIRRFEGCHLTAYKCPAGVWTIGYGHTGGVKEGQKISQIQAEKLLAEDVKKYEKKVYKYFERYKWTQNEFDALVSFAFNVGSIDQLSAYGNRPKGEIGQYIPLYNKAGGSVLAGLTKRRKAEQELFLKSPITPGGTRAVIRKKSRGEDVIYLQKQLLILGYGVGAVDGIFGMKTLEAVKAFQVDNNLSADGIVGPKTWAVLG